MSGQVGQILARLFVHIDTVFLFTFVYNSFRILLCRRGIRTYPPVQLHGKCLYGPQSGGSFPIASADVPHVASQLL